MGRIRRMSVAACVAAGLFAAGTIASADGTETLGTPSVAIAAGSGVAIGGTGLEDSQPQDITIDVPAGATVVQVLAYWEGHASSDLGGDDTLVVQGNEVQGTLIGGPTLFFGSGTKAHWSSTYRADITALGVVGPGTNVVSVGGLTFDQNNNGAGLLAIYDDGSTSEIAIVDGNDLAFVNFAGSLQTTVAQTLTFAPEPVDRNANLDMFFSSVAGPDLAGLRPSTILVTIDGVETAYNNLLGSNDGNEWDSIELPIVVPAGVGAVTVQALSENRLGGTEPLPLPASFAWNAASLSIPVTPPPPPTGGEGCTPGYWKQPHHFDSWVGYQPTESFGAVFGVPSTATLLEALSARGGGERALMRHATAALLNTSSSVSYAYSTAEVIAAVQQAYATGDFNGVKNVLAAENEMGCPLN